MKAIRLLVPDLPSKEELLPYLQRIDASRRYSNFGPLVQELEARMAARLRAPEGKPGVVTVANATLGLELALLALRLPPGAHVLVPALTFVASAASIVRAGLVPLLCDVAEGGWVLTPELAGSLLRDRQVGAVMPITTYGCTEGIARWDRFAAAYGVPVVMDAAGAFDNHGDAGRSGAVFSLHATKALGAGEGGFLVSTDPGLVAEVRRLANFGIDLSTGMVPSVGTNGKLSEYHAAVALASLDGWEPRRQRRIALHRHYVGELARYCPSVQLQRRPVDGVYSIMPVSLPQGVLAGDAMVRLGSEGVETRRWYCPTLESHVAFRNMPIAGELKVSRELSDRLLALPFHPFMSEEDVSTVCRKLAAVVKTASAAG